jgi:acetyl esterase/lipase
MGYRRTAVSLAASLLCICAICHAAVGPTGPIGNVAGATFRDIVYAKIQGLDPKLNSLDIYAPAGAKTAPVMVWVHGGGWARGDKGQVTGLPAAFVREGFVLASVNYRLAPAVEFDAQAQDVASKAPC